MPEYLFDLKLNTSLRVNAANESEARSVLIDQLDCADANFGAWPNGDPIVGEASVDRREMTLMEVDGKDPVLFSCRDIGIAIRDHLEDHTVAHLIGDNLTPDESEEVTNIDVSNPEKLILQLSNGQQFRIRVEAAGRFG